MTYFACEPHRGIMAALSDVKWSNILVIEIGFANIF